MRRGFTVFILIIFMTAITSTASAFSITYSSWNSETGALEALNQWLNGSSYTIIEDFEEKDPLIPGVHGGIASHTVTNGTLTAGGSAGQGAMSFDRNNPEFGVMYRDTVGTANYGRTLLWQNPSMFGNRYLDSGDVTHISLALSYGLPSLFFFMTDVEDSGGQMTMRLSDSQNQMIYFDVPNSWQANGSISFVGITTELGATLKSIEWIMSSATDGYGLDNFGTANSVAPVPEPATLILLGTGLLGLGAFSRRRLARK